MQCMYMHKVSLKDLEQDIVKKEIITKRQENENKTKK
jgi:hypothetical protein